MTYRTLLLSGLFLLLLPGVAAAYEEQQRTAYGEQRTANRTTSGEHIYPQQYFVQPEHYPFLPITSNHDAQHQHPAQWAGQDWDPAAWNPEQWTPEIAIAKFFSARIFERQYMHRGKLPVLEVGYNFFRLSDLDRRRALKLLADHSGIFEGGHEAIVLRDAYTKKPVGSYTRHGMQLN